MLSTVRFTERELRFLHETMGIPGVHTRKLVTQYFASRQHFASAKSLCQWLFTWVVGIVKCLRQPRMTRFDSAKAPPSSYFMYCHQARILGRDVHLPSGHTEFTTLAENGNGFVAFILSLT